MGTNTSMVFAGIELDTVQGECRLPQDKLLRCRSLIDTFLVRRKVMPKEIQSLVGTLNFACIVVVPGRAFLRRLIDLTKCIKKPNFYIRLTKEVKADLLVWKQFLDSYNGKTHFMDAIWHSSESLCLFTDAAGSLGYGGIFSSHLFFGEWPADWEVLNIAVLELFPIMLALEVWGHYLSNKQVLLSAKERT
ncbi:uncharacterized protein LOC102807130 [Saccoglossus kowalevskii]|uniref:Uncharacterized protein LOC102807130 n=1 Tax=Saccoglossus kowalevskii TaxID=10224 RepID=A0ABM0MYH9_SACKO|nr:PREDICTED: uncharacterized protein LOC102807130 [Saccoglossus kowalevskii]